MQFLSKETKIDFQDNLKRDNETSKKYGLIRYIEYFQKEIIYYKKYLNKWQFLFLKIDYYYLNILSYLFALVFNLLLLFTITGDNRIVNPENKMQKNIKIKYLISSSINKWSLIYDIIIFLFLVFNGIIIILWIIYKLPLYFQIDQIKYKELLKINKNKKLNLYDKIYVLFNMCIFGRNYISMFLYEFFVCILCLSIKNSEIIYTLLLLPILFISKTLKSIIISIRLNFKQFCLTFFLAFFIIYIFSNLYFFFHNSDFNFEFNSNNDNYCKTLVFSFLNGLDNGLRARGGLGDSAKRISFLKNRNHYLSRLLLDDLFFLLIVIIMIDLVFGIIIKSFDELRHRSQKYKSDKKNYCSICHSNRKLLEKMRINYNEHINIIHNVWNYIEYMISLKLKDINDLNSINQYVRTKIERKDITWLPSFKDKLIKNDICNEIEENNLIVFMENCCEKIKENENC
jgi:hypothetical protein